MVLGRRATARLLAMLAVATNLLVLPSMATATEPAPGEAVVVDLPTEARAQPRLIRLLGRTDDGHLLMVREVEPTPSSYGFPPTETVLIAPDGDEEVLDPEMLGVVGDRVVGRSDGHNTYLGRLTDGSGWSAVQVPDLAAFLGYTVDGVLFATGPLDDRTLSLLPWDGTAAVAIPGFPPGTRDYPVVLASDDSHVLVASMTRSGSSSWLLVDTASEQAWSVDHPGTGCDYGTAFGMNEGKLVWLTEDGDTRALCSMDVPEAGASTTGPITERAVAGMPSAWSTYDFEVLPVGEDVVVAATAREAVGQWADQVPEPLMSVAPDGATRTLAGWAYEIAPAQPGHVVAVTGAPGDQRVSDVAVGSGEVTEAGSIPPIRAEWLGIAIDGDRVVYADDSAYVGAAREMSIDFDGETTTPSTLLDTDVSAAVAAGGGAAAWSKSVYLDHEVVHLASDGRRSTNGHDLVAETDDRWVRAHSGSIWDSVADTYRSSPPSYADGSLQDGVAYAPGSTVPGGPEASVLASDLETGETTSIPVAGCRMITSVSVAGSWLLADCVATSGEVVRQVVDRTGATATRPLPATDDLDVHLGNGFAVARSAAGDLTWTPLSGPTWDWQSLGTAAGWSAEDSDWEVAVSRGTDPTVAWIRGKDAHAARLPVLTSPLPAHPQGVAPPAPLNDVRAAGVDQAIELEWDRPDDTEAILGYRVTATAISRFVEKPYGAVTVDAEATSATISNLSNRARYDVTITAYNIAGSVAMDLPEPATPVGLPAAPTDVVVVLDQATGLVTVTWKHRAFTGQEAVRHFSVEYDGALVGTVTAEARSFSFVLPQGTLGLRLVRVIAHGVAQESATAAGSVTIIPAPPPKPGPTPWPDTLPPSARLGVPSHVLLGSTVNLRISATDNQQLTARPIDVRWRVAQPGKRSGSWERPAAWQSMAVRRLEVPLRSGMTACFQARAHDHAGNVSAWSEPRCVVGAIDDRDLLRAGSTRRVSGKAYYRGGAVALRRASSSVRLPYDAVARGGWLVARTCPSCGRVRVMIGSTLLATVNLRSPVTHDRRLVPIRTTGAIHRGRVRLVRTGDPGTVVIDGVALLVP